MMPRSGSLAAVVGDGPAPAPEEDDETPEPAAPKAKPRKAKTKTAPSTTSLPSERTVTIEAPAWAPPERETTEQLNVRIPKSLHDWVKDHHRRTGEPMRSIVERALTMLQRAEETR
jgi:hypothetical protein